MALSRSKEKIDFSFGEHVGLRSDVPPFLMKISLLGRGGGESGPTPSIPRGAMGKTQREILPAGLPCGRCQLCAPLEKSPEKIQKRIKRKKIIMNRNSNISGSFECVATVPFVIFFLLEEALLKRRSVEEFGRM